MMHKKILFTGYYGFSNFGDDLFGLACINGLEVLGSPYKPVLLAPPIDSAKAYYLIPESARGLYSSTKLAGKLLRLCCMLYGCMKHRDVVLAGGSVISSDSATLMRKVQYTLTRIGLCRLSAIGVSIGPFSSADDHDAARKFLNSMTYLCVRDAASLAECRRLGVRKNVHLYNDLAACAPLPIRSYAAECSNVIGVSICRYESIKNENVDREEMRNAAIFAGLTEFAQEQGFHVRILVLNSNQEFGDDQISKSLYEYLCTRGVPSKIITYSTPQETLREISACRLFFSVRLHGAIAAYLLGIPFFLAEYHEKCTNFLDYIGVDKRVRITANTYTSTNMSTCLQDILRHGTPTRISANDYKTRALRIFSDSPWDK